MRSGARRHPAGASSWTGRSVRLIALSALAASAALASAGSAGAQNAESQPAASSADDLKAQAREHFQRGLELFSRNEWAPALKEFLKSREILPNRSNTQNAAVTLGKLGRNDEALEMFETLLRDFKDIPERDLADVQREIAKLQRLVGSIEIRTQERGATVTIDDRARGTTPLASRLRVNAGSHVVRVFKEGSEPFVARVDVAGGENEVVTPTLAVLARAGRLEVKEQSGKSAEVVVDGVIVGPAPWHGSLLPGRHAVWLRASGNLGAPPAAAEVRDAETTSISLSLERLDCSLAIQPQPANATIAVDGVEVGSGTWNGRLRCGAHHAAARAEGFLPASRDVALVQGKTETAVLDLDRDPESPLWKSASPARIYAELEADGVVSNGLGGDAQDSCASGCDRSLPLGFFGGAHGGYQFGSGVGLGVAVGYLWVRTTLRNRPMTPFDVPAHKPQTGVGDDRLTLHGPTFGVEAHFQHGESWPWMLRLGAGVMLGSLEDRRSANVSFTFSDGSVHPGSYGPYASTLSARYAYIGPEFRLARRLGAVELSLGIRPTLLIALTQPTLQTQGVLNPSSLGLAAFDETAAGRSVFLFMAGLGARYSFM